MPNPWLIVLALLALIAVGAAGYEAGRSAEAGAHALQRQKDIELAYKAGAAGLAAESLRAQAAELERDNIAQQLREIARANPVPPRADRRWTDDERRLLESRRAAYAGAAGEPATGALPGAVPGNARDRFGPPPGGDRSSGLGR